MGRIGERLNKKICVIGILDQTIWLDFCTIIRNYSVTTNLQNTALLKDPLPKKSLHFLYIFGIVFEHFF